MKTAAKIKHLFVWIGMAAYLALSFGYFQGMVLCHEADGTVSLESAMNGICLDAVKTSLEPLSKALSQAIECKQCFDQPVNLTGIRAYNDFELQKNTIIGVIPPYSENAFLSVGYLETITDNLFPQPPPRKPVIHQYLKSVVLII